MTNSVLGLAAVLLDSPKQGPVRSEARGESPDLRPGLKFGGSDIKDRVLKGSIDVRSASEPNAPIRLRQKLDASVRSEMRANPEEGQPQFVLPAMLAGENGRAYRMQPPPIAVTKSSIVSLAALIRGDEPQMLAAVKVFRVNRGGEACV